MLSLAWQLFQARLAAPTVDWALAVAGGLYLGVLSAHVVRLRALPDGLAWTMLALLVTWSSDSGAYFVGRAWGRRKLCPRLSPGKTWEGIAGGLAASLLAGALLGYLLIQTLGAVGPVHGLAVGLLVAIISPLGDLAESMMKREVHAKDSGSLIPGHGGVWDRIDSLLFVIPATYYYAVWIAGRS
jgi:phosphatidate cytidylyltransferase